MLTTGRHSYEEHLPARFTFTYGYAEIRARVPAGVGLWSAFWLLPATHKARPEIDVMEIIGHEPDMLHMHFHYRDADGEQQSVGGDWRGPDFSRGWHRFGVDWRPGAIVWYVDGVERFRFDDRDQIPAQPMYLLLNLAVGGDWPGEPDPSTRFPSTFEIDYVRVWQQEKHRKPRSAAAGGGRTARSRAAMVRPRPRGAS
jgi:beta-glucanase (GH16 family)